MTVNFRFKPIGSCTDTLDGVLEYQLPPGYNHTPINEVKATCNKTILCGGIEFKCVGAHRPYPMSFQHVPSREIKASGGSFSGTYRYVSSSIAPPRAALLRRASIGNFEMVEESADKKDPRWSDFGSKSNLLQRMVGSEPTTSLWLADHPAS